MIPPGSQRCRVHGHLDRPIRRTDRESRRASKTGFLPTLLLLLSFGAPVASGYDYPVRDPLLSTVIETAKADQFLVPDKVPTRIRSIERFPEREVPKVFWNQSELRYSVSAQEEAAQAVERVMTNVPGTGVMRHADAGYGEAIDCARERGIDLPLID